MTHFCTYCGQPGATRRFDDASAAEHWWHMRCLDAFKAWLGGKALAAAGEKGAGK